MTGVSNLMITGRIRRVHGSVQDVTIEMTAGTSLQREGDPSSTHGCIGGTRLAALRDAPANLPSAIKCSSLTIFELVRCLSFRRQRSAVHELGNSRRRRCHPSSSFKESDREVDAFDPNWHQSSVPRWRSQPMTFAGWRSHFECCS